MDYTTVERVKQEIHATLSYDDALLGKLVTAASRAFDRKCTGVPDAVDYFKLETVVGEVLKGQVDWQGSNILCYPHKPIITSVTAFSFSERIIDTVTVVDVLRIEADGPQVRVYPTTFGAGHIAYYPSARWGTYPIGGGGISKVRITMSYIGGLGATTADLPEDLQEMVAILAARFYREAETGLTDQMGVAELGIMAYTKAWPIRVVDQMGPYIRRVGWRHVA
jgi:hypothetical protein